MRKMSKLNSVSISIIIPALNEEKIIGHCLESIDKLNMRHLVAEVIVVDNGSTDNTIQISESYGAKVLIKREGTISSLRNYGAKASTGDILAFLDADCVVPQDWLERSLYYLHKRDPVVLGFRLSVPDSSNWVAKCWDLLFVKRDVTAEVDWVPTGNIIMTRKTFMSVGGFNPKLETNEDYDFCFRAKTEGFTIISSAETAVTHLRPPESLTGIFKKELWHGKEAFGVFLKDVFENKRFNFLRGKNFKPVAYSIFHLICILFLVFSLAMALSTNTFFPLLIGLMCPMVVSFLLAYRYVRSAKKYNLILGMTILLMVYGFSRALSLLSYNNLKTILICFSGKLRM
jgi:glycosyltransferase involved in cell wall biosynthesis